MEWDEEVTSSAPAEERLVLSEVHSPEEKGKMERRH